MESGRRLLARPPAVSMILKLTDVSMILKLTEYRMIPSK